MTFVPGVVSPARISEESLWFLSSVSAREAEICVRLDAERARLPSLDEVRAMGITPCDAEYLGTLNGQDCYAASIAGVQPCVPFECAGLRSLHARLDAQVFAVAGAAVQVVNFRATHRFCGRCSALTVKHSRERCVECPACGLTSYPRLSPAIIVLLRRGKQALLASSTRPGVGFYSTLAGFVEIGESLEQTLHREVREEVGLDVTNLRYFGSEPWPFPHSLMVGFTADYAGGEIEPDPKEIGDAQWFSADALPKLPPKVSIARRLIDTWLAEVG